MLETSSGSNKRSIEFKVLNLESVIALTKGTLLEASKLQCLSEVIFKHVLRLSPGHSKDESETFHSFKIL